MLRKLKILKIQAIQYIIGQGAVTGLNAEPITATSVVDDSELWYVAVFVLLVAGGSSRRSFGVTFTK